MENTTELGFNRTGAQSSPLSVHSMQVYADEQSPPAPPTPDGMPDGKAIATVRSLYAAEAERVGSVPMPGTVTGAFNTVLSHLRGRNPEVLVDKLGERLAFERTGVRLYDALMAHVNVVGDTRLGPTAADLRTIRDEEHRHFELLRNVIEEMGGDPTVMTPCANVSSVESHGLVQVLADPRSSRSQCLHAILVAELADNEGWKMLVDIARGLGRDDLVARFEQAAREEERHLERVRGWLDAQVQVDLTEGRVGVDA